MSEEINLPTLYEELDWKMRKQVREKYVEIQGGNCCHCFKPLSGEPPKEILQKKIDLKLFPEHFFKYPIHLHHSHKTGLTIGAVHNYCNAVLWQYYGE